MSNTKPPVVPDGVDTFTDDEVRKRLEQMAKHVDRSAIRICKNSRGFDLHKFRVAAKQPPPPGGQGNPPSG